MFITVDNDDIVDTVDNTGEFCQFSFLFLIFLLKISFSSRFWTSLLTK